MNEKAENMLFLCSTDIGYRVWSKGIFQRRIEFYRYEQTFETKCTIRIGEAGYYWSSSEVVVEVVVEAVK
jgi:hypothetical protein